MSGFTSASGSRSTRPTDGQLVAIQPVFSGFWGAHFAGAGRVRPGRTVHVPLRMSRAPPSSIDRPTAPSPSSMEDLYRCTR